MTTDDKKAINTSSTPSLWISDCPIKEYPVLTKDLSTQVLIIGGGITGLSCAYELTEAGFDVVLIEKDELCSKATGNSTGKLTLQHSSQYSDLLAKNMTQAAQDLLASQTKAIARFREITAQLDIDCDQIETKAVLYGRTKSELKVIDKEQAAYDQLGIPYEVVAIEFEEGRGLAVDGQIGINAAKYVYALADHLSQRGVLIFEHSQAQNELELTPAGNQVKVNNNFTITAQYVIIASGYPAIDGGGHYSFRLVPSRSLALAYPCATIEHKMYISQEEPLHSVRYSQSPENYLILVGGSHRVAFESSVQSLQDNMKQFAQTQFGAATPAFSWSAQDYLTADLLPYIGRLTEKEEHQTVFVATGFRKWGLGFGIWTGLYLTDLIKENAPEIETFRPARDMLVKIALDQTVDKTKMVINAITERQRVKHLDDIGINQAGIVKVGGKKTGVWVDAAGQPNFVNLSCTHMGCTLHWNDLDQTYDCPCHGSRFTKEGYVIEGPAGRDLDEQKGDHKT